MYSSIIKELTGDYQKIIERLQEDFANIRTGRASTSLVENIKVNYYGSVSVLKQMATLSTPDASQIVIQPWDKNALGDIELAVKNSELNLSGVNDGVVVRIVLPPMTEERRNELIRNISKKGEEARIALRNVRQQAWDRIKKMEKDGDVTEDDRYSAEKELNEIIENYNKKIEEIVKTKELALRTV